MKKINLDANKLKFMALFFMLVDHMWATVIPGNQWMTFVGRLAFPIFAFQLTEGFRYTSDLKKYKIRLLIFALISEIPFDLMTEGLFFYPFHQNVMFTLLLGLIMLEYFEKYNGQILKQVLVIFPFALLSMILFVDYGIYGIITIILFHILREHKVLLTGSLAILYLYFFKGFYIPINIFGHTFDFETQGFALLALIPIFLYNGKKDKIHPFFDRLGYYFYPVHMLTLYVIRLFILR